jgi:chorismate-pyruvate lyase
MHARTVRAAAVIVVCACALGRAQDQPAWPDTFESRLEALALIETLNADLLSSRSATTALEQWCGDHRLADNPTIVATTIADDRLPATAEQRQRLQVSDGETVAYRHVRLRCGARTLSDARNWYVPSRLTPEMNRQLVSTDTPFGRVVRALEPYRRTFAATRLWSPLPPGWERGATPSRADAHGLLEMPDALLEHRAVLYTREHLPFAEVDEVYQRQLLAFAPRR